MASSIDSCNVYSSEKSSYSTLKTGSPYELFHRHGCAVCVSGEEGSGKGAARMTRIVFTRSPFQRVFPWTQPQPMNVNISKHPNQKAAENDGERLSHERGSSSECKSS